MNVKNKLSKKSMKTVITMMLVAVFLIGEMFSPFAILANAANNVQNVKIEVLDYDTKEPIPGVTITFDKNSNSFYPVVATENPPVYDSYLKEQYNYIAYNVNNGRNRTIDVSGISGYSIYNMYKISKNKITCFVYQGIQNPPYVINPNTELIKIELKKTVSTNVSKLPEVTIDVADSSGPLDEYFVSSDNSVQRVDRDVTANNYVLKGDSYADFSLNSSSANAFQYSIVQNSGRQTNMPTSGWTDINLQAQQVNQDVDLNSQGYLTQRAYDVNHMATLTDSTNWSDPTQVFKYPYPEIGYKSADTSTTKDAYGYEENVVPYTITNVYGNNITVNSRWHNNTAFMTNMDIFGAYKEASKFWGYITVPQDGNYIFGASSDDGCRGWITVNGETNQFVNMFQPQSVTFGSTNVTLSLKQGQYYPIYLEYFNWGGSAAFQLYYTNTQSIYDGKKVIPKAWFYPSKSTSPGEYAQTLFTGSQGVKLPNTPGQYYIAYRTGNKGSDGNISNPSREGIYGPFIVKPTAPLTLNNDYDRQNAVAGKYFQINYTITPNDIPASEFNGANQPVKVSNIKFNEVLPSGLTTDDQHINPSSNLQVVVNGNNNISGNISQDIIYTLDTTGTKYVAQPINFSIYVKSDTVSNYTISGQNSYINYQDIDDGNRLANFNDLGIAIGVGDIIPPAAPVITTPANNTVTNDNTPTISGTAEANSTVKVYDGTTLIGTVTADGSGNWTLVPSTGLVDGNHVIKATATDAAENVSQESNLVNIRIDTARPAAPVITTPANNTVTNDNTPTISGTAEANSTVKVYDGTTLIGTVTADGNGTWTLTPLAGLADGMHVIKATATDAAGNVSTESNIVNIRIDTARPAAPVINVPRDNAVTNNNRPAISGTAEANSTVKVYDGTTLIGTVTADGNGNWTLVPTTALIDGNHVISATATDVAGNVSLASNTVNITIDTIAPTLTLVASPTSTTSGRVIITAETTDGGSGVASIINVTATDGKTEGTVTNPVNSVVSNGIVKNVDGTLISNSTITYTISSNGAYEFTARDNAGNTTTQSLDINNIAATLQGIVVDDITNNPISGATVSIKNANGETISSGITGSDGKYTFNNIVAPATGVQVTIEASADDYSTQSFSKTLVGRVNGYEQNFSLTSTFEASRIEAHGIYGGNEATIADGNKATKDIPVTMAMVVNARSSHPVINWSVDDNTKITVDNNSFKGYEISEDGKIGNPVSLTIDGNGKITGITMQKDKKYLIVYTITPSVIGTITSTATADGNYRFPVALNVGDRPDLF